MKFFTQTVASLSLLGILAGPAFAASENQPNPLSENDIVMTTTSGAVTRMKMTDTAMMDMMVKEATPMTAGSVMMMHGGKMYMMTDHKMPNGKMMSDILAGK